MDKATEIAKLEQFASQFDKNTYLHSFLSSAMVGVIIQRVQDDTSCDILADLEYASKLRYAAQDEMRIAISERDAAISERDAARAQLDRYSEELQAERARFESACQQLTDYGNDIDAVRRIAQSAWFDGVTVDPLVIRNILHGQVIA